MDEEKTTNLWTGTTYGRSIEQQKNERTIKITGTIAKHTDAPKARLIPVTTYHPDEQQTTEKGRINMANGKPGRPPKFQAPKPDAYNSVIQSSTITTADPAPVEYYRFNAKLPIEVTPLPMVTLKRLVHS